MGGPSWLGDDLIWKPSAPITVTRNFSSVPSVASSIHFSRSKWAGSSSKLLRNRSSVRSKRSSVSSVLCSNNRTNPSDCFIALSSAFSRSTEETKVTTNQLAAIRINPAKAAECSKLRSQLRNVVECKFIECPEDRYIEGLFIDVGALNRGYIHLRSLDVVNIARILCPFGRGN